MSKPLAVEEIRDRIVEVKEVRFGSILNNPKNPKSHPANQRDAFRGSVRQLGVGTIPIAYYSQRAGGQLVWGDGHMRGSELADYVGKVGVTDFTDEEIDAFLLYADPIAAMAEYESQQLDGLLRQVQTGDEALQAMLAGLAESVELYPNASVVQPPSDFGEYGKEIETQYCCPKCGYKWSGKPA